MRPGPDARCSPRDAGQCCAARWDAVRLGRFAFSFRAHGWLWKDADDPTVAWPLCPWCRQELPNATQVYERIRRALRRRDDDD